MSRKLVAYAIWPVLVTSYISVIYYGFSIGQEILFYNLAFFSLAFIILILERVMPFEQGWSPSDGQIFQDLGHTALSKGFVQGLIVLSGALGLSQWITPMAEPGPSWSIWPRDWPLLPQILLTLLIAEFALYWMHRLAHEWHILWRFHTIHHSVTRLWVVNTGRFHIVDSVASTAASTLLLTAFGAPMEMMMWFGALTAMFGFLTHCNVAMKTEWLSYVFVTPALHRWHHSKEMPEGNSNYGENIAIWDQVFQSWFLPATRRPPKDIGIKEPMPRNFLGQILFPFRYKSR